MPVYYCEKCDEECEVHPIFSHNWGFKHERPMSNCCGFRVKDESGEFVEAHVVSEQIERWLDRGALDVQGA